MPGIGPVTCGRDIALGSDGRARLGRCCDPTLGRWKLGVCGRAMPPMPPGIPAGRCAVGMFGRAVGIFGRAVGMFGRAVGMFGRAVGMFGRAVGMFGRAVGICGRGVGICGLACGAGRDIAGLPPPAPPTPPARPIDGRPWASAATRTTAMAHQTQPSRRPTARRRMDSYFLESVEKGTDAPGTSRESGTSQAFPSHFAAAADGAVAGAGGLRAITSLKSGS
jgi:hypothetical protein